ncbi:hypothetical protein RVR_2901 [Actinacidiphila reveromycinica]|uniref:Uncharacterized protein n=1 Tax=Actinacidiphila reveromycinica TaxID=659352 RepID=A0A7U3URA7_9ACTN|nr:hypothetical protein [Streptomyces sp. SN-593]BBA97248.1 hypothetical protein RVR_2901 [Streptomyces sp. SN-593]
MTHDSERTARVGCEGVVCRGRSGVPGQARALAPAGSLLCPACVLRLTADLRRMPRLYDECARLLGGSDRPRERTSGGGSPTGLPFNTAAAEARSALVSLLRSWARLVVEERVVAPPRDTVAGAVAFLVRHVEWLAAHDAAGELTEEVARAVRRARRVTDPSPGRSVRVGTCVVAECGGGLTAVARGGRDGAVVEVRCAAVASHRWSGREWMALGGGAVAAPREDGGEPAEQPGSVGRPGPAEQPEPTGPPERIADRAQAVQWLSPRDVSLLWGIPSGSVYRRASEQKWRRRSGKGRTFYWKEDVLRSVGADGGDGGDGGEES